MSRPLVVCSRGSHRLGERLPERDDSPVVRLSERGLPLFDSDHYRAGVQRMEYSARDVEPRGSTTLHCERCHRDYVLQHDVLLDALNSPRSRALIAHPAV